MYTKQCIDTKNFSFKVLNTLSAFQREWPSAIKLEFDNLFNQMLGDICYVLLRFNMTTPLDNNTAFLCEGQQADIFTIFGIKGTQTTHYLNTYVLNILLTDDHQCITVRCLDIPSRHLI
ncbi:protein-export chaperone SecB [Sodalis endosymbiont of Henestaris halophilus]